MSVAWWVQCPDYSAGPFRSRGAAERRLAEVESLGACHHAHAVVGRQ